MKPQLGVYYHVDGRVSFNGWLTGQANDEHGDITELTFRVGEQVWD